MMYCAVEEAVLSLLRARKNALPGCGIKDFEWLKFASDMRWFFLERYQ